MTKICAFFLVISFSISLNAQQAWQQMGSQLNGTSTDDLFGVDVALNNNGETVVIGAQYSDANGTDSGLAAVYEWDGTDWVQKGADIPGEAGGDNAGVGVAISDDGNTVIIGSYKNDGNGAESGSARVFEWNGTAWIQKGTDLDGEAASDHCGVSVAISSDGNIIAIGAYLNDNTAFGAGNARVFQWNGTAWILMGSTLDGEAFGDSAGFSVSLNDSGSKVAVGAWANDEVASNAGHTRVHEWNTSNWSQVGSDIDGMSLGDYSGWSVRLNGSGNRIVVGEKKAGNSESEIGRVRVFEDISGVWTQVGQSIAGQSTGDNLGHRVSINDSGDRIIVGADKGDLAFTDAGEVRVFDLSGSTWTQIGPTLTGSSTSEWLGTGVSISGNGSTIALGAPNHDGSATNSGAVSIYFDCSTFNADTSISLNGYTLTSNANGMQYQWVDCNNNNSPIAGANGQSFTPSSNGSYAVQVSDGVCTRTSACQEVGGIGYNEWSQGEIQVFPNPTNDLIYLKTDINDPLKVKVYSSSGQLLSVQNLITNNAIQLPPAAGVYFLKVESMTGVYTFKVNKQSN